MKNFDRKFGEAFLSQVPTTPGVYRFLSETGDVLYVGKAKNLRKRLTNYRDAKRSKKYKKMRRLVEAAAQITWEEQRTELDAFLTEIRLIQQLKPKENVSGAFCFLYPYIGVRRHNRQLSFCFTTKPKELADFTFYGAFRSRELVKEAFFGLVRVLHFVGHRTPLTAEQKKAVPEYSYVYTFRKIPEHFPLALIEDFFRGRSTDFLETLILELLRNAGARAKSSEIQDSLDALKRFWKKEIKVLTEALAATGYAEYPVAQEERDPLMLSYRQKEI